MKKLEKDIMTMSEKSLFVPEFSCPQILNLRFEQIHVLDAKHDENDPEITTTINKGIKDINSKQELPRNISCKQSKNFRACPN
jgi:hypothetical protein